ncbi:MAG TPA: ABC transporter substrate-binding protein [Thermomicrobiales bacterium]|nr:ABC transporter substrate-binding protein [Thermomicrobiales bacterium]
MDRPTNRRTLLKGAAAAGAAAVAGVSKRSTTFAAPAVLQSTGSTVNITYWGSWSGDLGKAEQEVVKRFNDSQQDVHVDYQFQGSYEETAQKLTAALAAKQTPDVSALSDVWWFKFYLNQVLTPLNDLFAANKIDTSDYVDSLFNEGVRDGQSYWVPFARSTPLFYYNKDAFAEIGQEAAPKTWSEFAEFAPKLVKKDGSQTTRYAFTHANAATYVAWFFQGVNWAWGGKYSDPDFNILINKPETVAAGEFMRKSVQDGWANVTQDINNGPDSDFYTGLSATTMGSTGGLITDVTNAKFNVGVAFLPEEKTFGCCTGGAGLAVLTNAAKEKQEAGFKYVAFATSPEITSFWAQNTGYMPVRKSAIASKEMQDFFAKNPNYKVAVDQLPKTGPQDSARVFIPNGDQIIGKGLEQILINNSPSQQAFDDVAKTLTEEAQPVIEAIKALKQ